MVTSSDSDRPLDPVRRVLEKAVGRGAASGAVALVGRGDNVHVLAVGTKARRCLVGGSGISRWRSRSGLHRG
jgi:hypothetical protein